MFTRAFLFLSVMVAASFAQAIQPAKPGTAQATQQAQQPAAEAKAGQPASKLMAQASQQPTPVSGQPRQPNSAANTSSTFQAAQSSNCANSGSGPCVVAGHIVYAGTGWGGEAFYITLDTPMSPACPNTGNANGAAVVPSLVQYKEMVAGAIYALSTGRRVDIWFNGCFNGVAQVVAMNIYNQ
jgi:hypothetical protein